MFENRGIRRPRTVTRQRSGTRIRLFARPAALLLALCLLPAAPASGAFPGRNGKIAFGATGKIYVVRPDGTGLRRLPLGPEPVGNPSWSPSGRRIVFGCDGRAGDAEVCVARADGSHRRKLTSNNVTDADASWSPDGETILFTRAEGPYQVAGEQLIALNLRTKTERVLLYRPDGIFSPGWSPDGGTIAYSALGPLGVLAMDIFTIPADGSEGETNLTNSSESERRPGWSPDGQRIAFDRYIDTGDIETQTYAIFTMRPDGTDQKMVARSGRHPAWSPNGRRIAFDDLVNHQYDAIFTVKATGGDRKRLTGPTISRQGAYFPDWQPR